MLNLLYFIILISFINVKNKTKSDQSTPICKTFTIIDKEIQTGYRSTTSYKLKVERSEISYYISVDDEVYYSFEKGDEIKLSIYNGAFKEAYYIYEKG